MNIGNGWTGTLSTEIIDNQLHFADSEMLINNMTYLASSDNTEVEASFIYNGIDIGLILWYNENIGYIEYILSSDNISIVRHYKGNTILLMRLDNGERLPITQDAQDTTEKLLEIPQEGESVTLKAVLYRTNVKCYLNGDLVFNFEQNAFNGGKFGIYGTAGAKCTSFIIKSNNTTGWNKNIIEGCLCTNDNYSVRFNNGTNKYSYIYQSVQTEIDQPYTISVPYKGSLYIQVLNEENIIAETRDTSEEIKTLTLSFVSPSESIEVRIGTDTQGETVIYPLQIENKAFATSITRNKRGRAYLSFPAARLNLEAGGLSLIFKPLHKYTFGRLPVFYYNEAFNMYYEAGSFYVTYGEQTFDVPFDIDDKLFCNIVLVWLSGDKIELSISSGEEAVSEFFTVSQQNIQREDAILIGCDNEVSGNVILDKLIIYSGEVSLEQMAQYTVDDTGEPGIIICTDFAEHTLVLLGNKIIVPTPRPVTPIIVQSEDGSVYERVYFINNDKYSVTDTVEVNYTGNKTFVMSYNNILSARAYSNTRVYNDISIDGNKITINDLELDDKEVTDERLSTVDNVAYHAVNKNWIITDKEPVIRVRPVGSSIEDAEIVSPSKYTISYKDGLVVFKEPVPSDHVVHVSYTYTTAPTITIQYTPRNVFCANYDSEAGGLEITLSNTDGKTITITYENEYGAKKKLVATVEANPFKASNNNGFVYITNTPIPVTSIDVTVTPSALIADGHQVATITVSCLGEKGVPTSNALISVELEHGNKYGYIEKYMTQEEKEWLSKFEEEKAKNGEESAIYKYGQLVTDEHISGRFIYKFHVNNIVNEGIITEKIIVIDEKSGIGTEVPITIITRS